MKHIKFPFRNVAILTLLLSSFIACDKDFANLDTDIIGDPNFGTDSEKYDIIAYNKKLNAVQTNNLPINLLGIYNDPLYGLTKGDVVTQVSTSILDPDFGENVVLDSVVLTIPYFSRATGVTENGNTTYQLDSIYGSSNINLYIYESNYFLRSFDPNSAFNEPQRYYSDRSTSPTNTISTSSLEGQLIHTELNFSPSADQIILKKDDEISERLAPAIRIKLDTEYWVEKIINQGGELELSNTSNFQDYFRGLYFKTEAINDDGSMMLLNFGASNANVTLYYSRDSDDTTATEQVKASFSVNFNGNKVNFLSNDFNFPLFDGNSVEGDEKLFLKAGEGSMAFINLFGGTDLDENIGDNTFEQFKNDFVETDENGKFVRAKRLINEANIVFYVDQQLTQGREPDRVYLYDTKNNVALFDYILDATNNASPNNSKINHLGKLERENNEPTGQGIRYKIRITEHINNLLLRDSTNVKLGLVVSGNVNLEDNASQRNVLNETDFKIPLSSVVSPRGTVLYGNNTTDESKKLYLEIFYTEPNN